MSNYAFSIVLMLALLIAVAPVSSQIERSRIVSNSTMLDSADQRERLDKVFSKYQVLDINLQQATERAQSTGRLSIRADGKEYDLRIEPNDIRTPSYRSIITTESGDIELPRQPVSTYKGIVAGHSDSEVRLLIQPDFFFGYINTGEDMLFIDPLSKFAPGAPATRVVLYRDADVHHDFEETCGTPNIEQEAEKLFKKSQFNLQKAVNHTQRAVVLATEADFEFFALLRDNSANVILGIINQVDGIYFRELNLRLHVTFQHVWATSNNPYTSTDAATLLAQFQNDWAANGNQSIPWDVAHLFTGKFLVGFKGIAALTGGVCSTRRNGHSLTMFNHVLRDVLVAHEIGHLLGACHDDDFSPPTADCTNNNGPIMCMNVQGQGPRQFSQKSKDDIAIRINNFGSCLSVTHPSNNFDFNGDGRTDFAVFQPLIGWWNFVGNGLRATQWGLSTDKLAPGDYDGDSRTDIAVWRPSDGTWYVINSTNGLAISQQWGVPTDVPVPGDYDGDRKTDFAVWRPSDGDWFIINSSTGSVTRQQWGLPTDKPVPGDYDGDGKTDFAVWRPSDGDWHIRRSSNNTAIRQQWGLSTDKLVPGDYDGDGKTDLAVWEPSTGTWFVVNSSNGTNINRQWGLPSDKPVPGDYDGDGKTDFAVYRPSTATWYVVSSFNGASFSQLHNGGLVGDMPVPNALVRN